MKSVNCKQIIYLFLLVLMLCNSIITNLNGQEIFLNKGLLDSLLYHEDYRNDSNRRIIYNLCDIHRLNTIKRKVGQNDTIKVYQIDAIFKAKYKSKWLNLKNRFIKEDGLITLLGTKGHTFDFFFAETFQNEDKSNRITVSTNKLDSDEPVIKIENYKNEIICGEFKEFTWSGKILTYGHYNLKDSTYLDTVVYYDSETYEEIIKITNRSHVGVKCGEWIIQNKKGQTETVKMQKDCK